MNQAALIIGILVILIALAAWYHHSHGTSSGSGPPAGCSALNVQYDLSGNPVLCPPASAGVWTTTGGSAGIHSAGSCGASPYKNCNRCIGGSGAVTLNQTNTYKADSSIGLAAGWPNAAWKNSWPPYAGPITGGNQMFFNPGALMVTDPAPVPSACL